MSYHSATQVAIVATTVDLHMQVNTLETGEIDYDELRERLVENSHRPAILNVNIGTTVKGAVDDLDRVSGWLGSWVMVGK